jgi:hypothetical protein
MIGSFLTGVIVGGLVVWRWRQEIQGYVSERTEGVRRSAADRLQAVEETAERVLDRTARPLRRVEQAIDQAKTQVRETLRAGQEAIRPEPTPEDQR